MLGAAVFIEADPAELGVGTHDIDFSLTAPNNHGAAGAGQAVVPPNADHFRAVIPFQVPIDALGLVTITVKIKDVEATATITIGRATARPGTGTGD